MAAQPGRRSHPDAGDEGDVEIAVRLLNTPIGVIAIAASETHVLGIELPRRRAERGFQRSLRQQLLGHRETAVLSAALQQLREYFAGKRRGFDLPIDPAGTAFQRRVWRAVGAIPFGETVAYGAIGAAIGTPQIARAVGAAVRANPIPIVIPCHRVIGADGSLTGYSAGLRRKIWLLRHEGILLA
jgi:methylated-DNA-[protein]-cysteine S-methyltransferase